VSWLDRLHQLRQEKSREGLVCTLPKPTEAPFVSFGGIQGGRFQQKQRPAPPPKQAPPPESTGRAIVRWRRPGMALSDFHVALGPPGVTAGEVAADIRSRWPDATVIQPE
jgi:hypothetical protein